jgi:streptomycin 6-kinase
MMRQEQTGRMSADVEVPEAVRRKALAVGSAGEHWLGELGRVVAELEAEWGVQVGDAIVGGSGAYVANAVAADGTDAVLKVAIPDGLEGHCPFARELQMLRLGDGHRYVRVLRADEDRRAMLQERLGRPLSTLGLPVESQIDVIAATLSQAWRAVPVATRLPTGAEQAHYLGVFIAARWEELGRPCPRRTFERAEQYTRARRDAFDASTSVLVHGDAHPANILEDTSELQLPMGFKLIDPEGMLSEPAHDLAIPLRDWTDQLLATDPVEFGLAWCAQLGRRAGVDSQAIWEWAFVERVSTGLFLIQLGDTLGERFLEVANHWTDERP